MLLSQRFEDELDRLAGPQFFFDMDDDSEEPSSSSATAAPGPQNRSRRRSAAEQGQMTPSVTNPASATLNLGQPPGVRPNPSSSYQTLDPFSFMNTQQPSVEAHATFSRVQLSGSPLNAPPAMHMPGVNPYAGFPNPHSLPPGYPPHLAMWPYMPQQSTSFNAPLPSNLAGPANPRPPGPPEHFSYPAFGAGPSRSASAQHAPPPTASTSPTPSPTATGQGQEFLDPEEGAVLEDKRRRNTAASARFRIKKKQKTLNLERTVSDLTSRADELEREASNLRRENTWLKEMVIMKGRGKLSESQGSHGKGQPSDSESEDESREDTTSDDTSGSNQGGSRKRSKGKGKAKATAKGKGRDKDKDKGVKGKKGKKS